MPKPEESDPSPAALEGLSRRHLTVLFTDLSDSTSLSAVLEQEQCEELTDDVRAAFERAVAAHGGTTNQLQGDGFQALFGAPHATEEDGRHAAEVALEVHEAVRALAEKYAPLGVARLSVHSGIHAGLVLVKPGDDIAGKLRVYGPAPGIAKHLSDIAGPDQILVTDETLGPLLQLFKTEDGSDEPVKGATGPLPTHRIVDRTPLRTRFEAHTRRGLVPFIGRQAELQRLWQRLDGIGQGAPAFVAISGSAGMGKTRLAQEFLQRAEASGVEVSRGYCEGHLRGEPLQPFLQMLRLRFGITPGTPAAVATLAVEQGLNALGDAGLAAHRDDLLQALSVPVDGTQGDAPGAPARRSPERTVAALRHLYATLARTRPQVVFIDDWHWADDATRQVVWALRELHDAPILILTSTRPLDLGSTQLAGAEVLALQPFSRDEAERSIRQLYPAAHPFVAEDIRRHAGGNALFIEELCHCAASAGPSDRLGALQGGPAWLETLIESRVTRLPAEQLRVLTAAAVIGNVVPSWLLEQLTGCDEHHPLVQELALVDLLFPGDSGSGTLRFKHGITRDVVYAAIGLQPRQAMHRRLAQLIHDRLTPGTEAEACESLAYHHAGAGAFEAAARYAELAGDKAMSTSSIDRAKVQYRAALDMLDRLPESAQRYQAWRSIVRRLGLASVYDPSRAELEVLERAVALARTHDDGAGLAYAEYWLAYVNYALGESSAAVTHCLLAAQAAERLGDARLAVQASTMLAQAMAAACDYPGALERFQRLAAPAPARAGARPDARTGSGIAYALACKASVLGDLGHFADAYACFDDALEARPWPGHEVEGSVLCLRSNVWLWHGQWHEARADAAAALGVAERVKSLYLFAMSRALGAYADWQIDRQPDALTRLAESVAWLESHDKRLFLSLAYGWLADALQSAGRPAAARAHAARALRRARKRDWLGAPMALRAMALQAAQQGDMPDALHHWKLAVLAASRRGSPHESACNDLCRAHLLALQGEREGARTSVERAAAAFRTLRMPWHLVRAQELVAELSAR